MPLRLNRSRTDFEVESLESRRLMSSTVYLSDLIPSAPPINGWGPYERDHSNGEKGANDGHQIKIDGVSYAKGLGVHSSSTLIYRLDGKYLRFQTDYGIDDETGGRGSAGFNVFLDGVEFSSNSGQSTTIGAGSPALHLDVDVRGVKELKLVVSDAGQGKDFGHADWADAKLIAPDPTFPIVTISTIQGATEGSANGIFRIRRSVTSDAPLLVYYVLSGNARELVDYAVGNPDAPQGHFYIPGQLPPLAATIPANESYVDVSIGALQDNIYDPNETVTLTVISPYDDDNPIDDYTPGVAHAATMIIQDDEPAPSLINLSDLTPTDAKNGWGPFERDHSNGETGSHDGHAIKLNGKTYTRGLGVHANSTLTYNLNKQYSLFVSDIGIDDEVGNRGSVGFSVSVDGKQVYFSGIMTGASPTQGVNIDVTGKSTLQLTVYDADDGNAFDHADWAGAGLVAADPAAKFSVNIASSTPFVNPNQVFSFAIRRASLGGLFSEPLTVNFTTSGSAVRGVDYELLGGGTPITGNSITIPAGSNVGGFEIKAFNDAVYKQFRDIQIALAPGDGYAIDPNKDLGIMWIQTNLPPV